MATDSDALPVNVPQVVQSSMLGQPPIMLSIQRQKKDLVYEW